MFKRIRTKLDTPITWGAYWKFSLICAAISCAISWFSWKAFDKSLESKDDEFEN